MNRLEKTLLCLVGLLIASLSVLSWQKETLQQHVVTQDSTIVKLQTKKVKAEKWRPDKPHCVAVITNACTGDTISLHYNKVCHTLDKIKVENCRITYDCGDKSWGIFMGECDGCVTTEWGDRICCSTYYEPDSVLEYKRKPH